MKVICSIQQNILWKSAEYTLPENKEYYKTITGKEFPDRFIPFELDLPTVPCTGDLIKIPVKGKKRTAVLNCVVRSRCFVNDLKDEIKLKVPKGSAVPTQLGNGRIFSPECFKENSVYIKIECTSISE